MGNCQISKSWCGLGLHFRSQCPETSYDKKAEEDNKNIFTNKHAMIF